MGRTSEAALERGLIAANERIVSLEKQVKFFEDKAVWEEALKKEAQKSLYDLVKKIEKKSKKEY